MPESICDLRVLFVDDNDETRKLVRKMLSGLAVAQIYTASDGHEALDFMGDCDDMVDVVLCDWRMPSMSGLDLLRQIRTVSNDLPFVMVTGLSDEQAVTDAKTHGATSYLLKPFTQADLRKKLTTVVRLLRAREQPY